MQYNNKFNQLDNLKKDIKNKKILLYGPGNKDNDVNKITNLFNKFDYIIIPNNNFNILNEKKINLSKYNIIHVLSGYYVKDQSDYIKHYSNLVKYYLVSEINTMEQIQKLGVPLNKVLHMSMNYNLVFSNPPTLGPKLLYFFLNYKLDFDLIKITGMTFFMDQTLDNHIYNLEYENILRNTAFKDLKNCNFLTDQERISYEGKEYSELPDKVKKLISARIHSSSGDRGHNKIFEGWNMFLRFIHTYKDKKLKLDNNLYNLLKKYPNVLSKDPF